MVGRFRQAKVLMNKLRSGFPTPCVLTPWKWSQDQVMHVFVTLPVSLGACFGIVEGADEGYQYSRHTVFPINFYYTTYGIMLGIAGGAVMGLLWPIALPLLFVRARYPYGRRYDGWMFRNF